MSHFDRPETDNDDRLRRPRPEPRSAASTWRTAAFCIAGCLVGFVLLRSCERDDSTSMGVASEPSGAQIVGPNQITDQ